MRQTLVVILLWSTLFIPTYAAEHYDTLVQEAEYAYGQGDYNTAIQSLLKIKGMAQIAPVVTPLNKNTRAKIFFDLGCCYLAAGDSVLANAAFEQAFNLNDRMKSGYFNNADSGVLWWALLRNQEAARRLKTTRLSAAMRSLFLPGWGQMHRGYSKKGWFFISATIVSAGVSLFAYRDFNSAKQSYDETNLQDHGKIRHLNSDGTRYSEFGARYKKISSSSRTANISFAVLGGFWAMSILDSIVWGPASIGIQVNF